MRSVSHTIYHALFPQKLQKSDHTKLRILESAIWCYVHYGIEQTTFENIATKAGVVRPLVMRYFPNKELLLELTIKYIRANLQNLAVAALQGLTQAEDILEAYIRSTFRWIEDFPEHAKVWLLFYYYCSIRREFLVVNSELVSMGQRRISEVIALGVKQKIFNTNRPSSTAKAIQNFMTGCLLAALTEERVGGALSENQVVSICFTLAKKG